MIFPGYINRARLVRIVDGDSAWFYPDLGYRVGIDINVRFEGIDAPERYTDAGKLATAWLSEQLTGKTLILVSTRIDKYGRSLGVVYVEGEEVSINDRMIEAGHAVPYFGGPRG